MRIWLIKDGEQLPYQDNPRPYRNWLLARELASRGHEVIWFHSTFLHQRKQLLFGEDHIEEIEPNLTLYLVYAGSYSKTFSIKRYLHHQKLAKKLSVLIRNMDPPDVINCAFPIIEVSDVFIDYAKEFKIPITIDIRDLWPDIFYERLPKFTHPLLKILLHGITQKTKGIFREADSLVSVTKGMLQWGLNFSNREKQPHDKVFYNVYPQDGISLSPDNNALINLIDSLNGKKIFTYIGAWGSIYNNPLLCEVIKKTNIEDVHFILGGEGYYSNTAREKLKNCKQVTFTGWLSKNDIAYILHHTYVALLPFYSIDNALPNKFFEALTFSLPIISSATGEMEEIIKQENIGIYYAPTDGVALGLAIDKLTHDRQLRDRQSQNAKRLIDGKFNAEGVIGAYASHVEAMAKTQIKK